MSNYRPQRSCGKVMLSQACVKNSVHRGGRVVWQTPPRADTPFPVHAGIHPTTQCMLGHTPLPSACWDTPPPATAVDGTHPTGMHSCLLPPAKEVCEDYVFTGVCLSTLGGHAWFYLGGHAWFYSGGACVVLFGGHAWFYLGGVHGFIRGVCVVLFGGVCMVLFWGHVWFYLGGCAWFYSGVGGMRSFIRGGAWFFQFFWIQSDTVNERAVRILLECILVLHLFIRREICSL